MKILRFMENSSKNNRKEIGFLGENIAARYLESRGYKVLFKNYQKPWGEIDIIAEKEGVIAFCEVKTNSKDFGTNFSPELRVNPKKAKHILRTAYLFLNHEFPGKEREWRIDIISVVLNKLDKKANITHFKKALVDTS